MQDVENDVVVRARYDSANEAWHVEINQVFVAAFRSKPEAEQTAGFIQACVTSLLTTRDAEIARRDEGIAHYESDREKYRTRIADLEAKLVTRDSQVEWVDELEASLAKAEVTIALMRPVCDAAVAWLDVAATADGSDNDALVDVIEAYQSARSKPETSGEIDEDVVDRIVAENMPKRTSVRKLETKPETTAPVPTPERRAQEIAHLEEKYAINAAVAAKTTYKDWPAHPHEQSVATSEVCGRCGAPYMATGYCSRRDEGCQGGRGEAMLPHPEVPRPEGEDDENWGRVRCSMYEAGHKQGLLDAAKELLAKLKPPFYVDGLYEDGQRDALKRAAEHLEALAAKGGAK